MTTVTLELLFHHAKAQHQIYLRSAHTSSCEVTCTCSVLYSSSKAFESTYFLHLNCQASIYSLLGALNWQEELTPRSMQRNNTNLISPNSDKVKMKSHWCGLRPDYKNCQKALLSQNSLQELRLYFSNYFTFS